jgi:acetoin utilization deacetylase AcuC-like enzyme
MTLSVISHYRCLQHDVGQEHPEQPARLHAIYDQLISSGLAYVITQLDGRAATEQEWALVHDRDYLAQLIQLAAMAQSSTVTSATPSTTITSTATTQPQLIYLDGDTALMAKSLDAIRYASGSVLSAIDRVSQGLDLRIFCAVRPPGHHARRAAAMGFCYINNVAVAAAYAMATYGYQRICIMDIDVHHGNGTAEIFRDDARVLFCSSFEDPFYPFTETEPNSHLVHSPLAAGSTFSAFKQQWQQHWLPAIDAFSPELILVSAGFDAHLEDEMAHLRWQDQDYQWVATQIRSVAERHCGGKVVASLEGGYALSALGRSVVAWLQAWL